MKKIIYIIIAFLSLWSCDDRGFNEGDILTAFAFKFDAKAPEEFFNNSIGVIKLDISNNHEVSDQNYAITFQIEGGGQEMFLDGIKINQNCILKKGKRSIDFKPLKNGKYQIKITASNGKKEFDITKEIIIDVKDRPFTPTVESDAVIYQSETNQIELYVKVNTPDWVTYRWDWNSSNKNTLKYLDNGKSIAKKEFQSIEPNKTIKLVFSPQEIIGDHILFFTFIDTQGQKIQIDKTISVKSIDFDAKLEPTKKDIEFFEKAYLEFSLKPEFKSNNNPTDYTIYYISEGTEGIVNIDGKELKNRDKVTLKAPFDRKLISFSPTKYNGSATIKFVIEDKFGYQKEVSTNINIKLSPYEIISNKITTELIEIDRKKKGKFSLDLRTNADVEKMKYQVRIITTSDDRGYFLLDGRRIDYDQDFILRKGVNELEYVPTEFGSGNHKIEFQASDLADQHPKNTIRPLEFKIYKALSVKSFEVGRTWVKHGHGSLKKPTYTMKYYLDCELEGSGEVKTITVKGWNKRDNVSFESRVGKNELKKTIKRYLLTSLNDVKGPQDILEPNDVVELIVGDEKGYIKRITTNVKDYN